MHHILLFRSDEQQLDQESVERVFAQEPQFRDVRFDEPGGAAVEAECVSVEGHTIVRLSGDRKYISLSRTSNASLQAALIIQGHLDVPLRIIDTDYSFDLQLQDFVTLEQLHAAIEKARAS